MKNTTDQSTGTALWSARPEPPTEPHRAREMPLLFQLADINRLPPAPAMPAAPVAASPAPISMSPLPSGFPTSLPIAAFPPTTFTDPWPKTPSSLYEMPAGLSTTALTLGLTTSPVEDRPQLKTKLPVVETASSEKHVVDKPLTEKPVAEQPAIEKKTEVVAAPPAKTNLPTVIDTAVKAAAIVGESKVESKVEAKAAVKSEVKADAKTSPAVASATTTAADPKSTPAATAEAPAEAAKPSPGSLRRQRAEVRQQKVEGKSNDWLSSHGKIIAIGFVIALIGTIYLARRNQPVREIAEPQTSAPVGLAIEEPGEHHHDHSPTEAANTAPRLVDTPSHPQDTTPSPAAADQHSPAPAATADLHPPVVPSTEPAPAGNNAPLFPWQQPGEARVATRPEATPPEAATTPAPAPGATAPAPSNAPTLNGPQYPETNLRDAPLLPPAPPAEQGRTRAPSRTSPASFTSTPGGNRYERTGSGLY